MPSSLSFFFHSSVGKKKIKIKKTGDKGRVGRGKKIVFPVMFCQIVFFLFLFFFPPQLDQKQLCPGEEQCACRITTIPEGQGVLAANLSGFQAAETPSKC